MIQPPAEDFLGACGAQAPLQLEVEHRGGGELARWTTALPFALIGREERADLRLDDKNVSRRHAYLQIVAGRCWWVDLDSRKGTHPIGTAPLRSRPRLGLLGRRGIRIGPYTIRLAEGSSEDETDPATLPNPLTSEADDLSSLPRLILEFRGGTEQQRTWMVDRPLTLVGRAAFCKVRLHSLMISRTHCALVNTPSGLWMIDLLGRGTSVNGTLVRWARLEQDDELHIDPFRTSVRYLAPAFHPNAASRQVAVSPVQELIPSTLPVPRNGNESLLVPLMAQFSLMQQQMFEQFQQTLMMMAQMFGKLNREQLALVRQELASIHDLKRQFQALQAEAARPTPAAGTAQSEVMRASKLSEAASGKKTAAAAHTEQAQRPLRPEGDVHTWLAQRLAALEEEKQTRWQRLLALLKGN